MKKLLILVLSISSCVSSYAKCTSAGIYPIAEKTIISENSLIILEFYGTSQLLVNGLGNKYPIFLQLGQKKIMLHPVEILKGDFQLTQVVLKPMSELQKGSQYEIFIGNLSKDERGPSKYNEVLRKWEPISYTVASNSDILKPVFTQQPLELKKTMCEYGCGPAKWVHYQLSFQDQSQVFVRTFVKNITTGKTTEYILAVEDNIVKVGHGMCSGGFTFEKDNQYEIAFMLIDASGNSTVKTTPAILRQPETFTQTE